MRNLAPRVRVRRCAQPGAVGAAFVGAIVVGLIGLPQVASAADPPPEGATLVRKNLAPSFRPWAGLEARIGSEMTWARWMMASEDTRIGDDDEHRAAPWLDLAVFRDGPVYARPDAEASAISALGSLVTAGLPMLAVRRDGRIRQKHSLRGWFRGRGVSLAWRIEF